mgnify:FL=1
MDGVTLLPADRYVVINKTILTDADRKYLISFYEPIIGHLAISLYLVLINDLEESKGVSRDFTHHHLMSLLKTPLKILREAREALEATGLLKTYFKKGDVNNYIYEIYSPLSPSEFFNHPILNIVLYNNIGATEYEYLKKQYQKLKVDTKEYIDITKKLDDVMESGINVSVIDVKERSINDILVKDQVDFDLILSSIPKGIINEKVFTKKTKELINNLAFIYKIDTLKMIELIRSVLNEYGMIDKDNLRINARKMYQFNNGTLPTLIYRSQPEYLKSPVGDNSMRGKIIEMFEKLNPVDFLRNKYGGAKPTNRDIKLIEGLIIDLEMPPAVVNVLLDYVLRKNNNKLATNYIETIAGQWKRAGLKNASEAMDFAEKENKKFTKKLDTVKASKEPVWFNKVEKIEEMSDADKKELENLLKEFK